MVKVESGNEVGWGGGGGGGGVVDQGNASNLHPNKFGMPPCMRVRPRMHVCVCVYLCVGSICYDFM